MKRVFNYGTAVALAIMLAFTACDNSSDEGGGYTAGITIPSYQSDLDGIAIAFADGAPEVYLKSDLNIGAGELVIPYGQTLDLTDRGNGSYTITGFADEAKMVILGNITFPGSKTIDISPTDAYIIAPADKVSQYVDVDEADTGKPIKARAEQIINVYSFDLSSYGAWESAITEQANAGKPDTYFAVTYSGQVNNPLVVTNINKYGSGRRLYILAKDGITFNGPKIDITGTKWNPPETAGSLFNARNVAFKDGDSSLVIAGQTTFAGNSATVETISGFTVLGQIRTGSDREEATIVSGGPFAAYTAKIDGGESFAGDVHLISKALVSSFGRSVDFGGNVTINGPVSFVAVTSDKKTITLNGPVEFKGTREQITGSPTFKLNSKVVISSAINPVDPIALDNDYNQPLVYSEKYGTTGTIIFNGPVTFTKEVLFGSLSTVIFTDANPAGDVVFMGPVTTANEYSGSFGASLPVTFKDTVNFGTAAYFNDDVTFEKAVTFRGLNTVNPRSFAGTVTTFKDTVTFGTDGDATFDNMAPTANVYFDSNIFGAGYKIPKMGVTNVTFGKGFEITGTTAVFHSATFKDDAYFGTQATFGTDATFNKTATFTDFGSLGRGKTTFNGDVVLSPGAQTAGGAVMSFNGTVKYTSSGKVITLGPSAEGATPVSIKAAPGGALGFAGGNIILPGSSSTVGSLGAKFENGAAITLTSSPTGGGSAGVIFTGTNSLDFDNYAIYARGGSLASYQNNIIFTGNKIAAAANKAGSLALHTTNVKLNLKKDITLEGVMLDLAGSGAVAVNTDSGGYSKSNIAITLSGGTLSDATTGIIAAGIKTSGVGIVGGTLLTAGAMTGIPYGLVLANGPQGLTSGGYKEGYWVSSAGTVAQAAEDGGTIAKLGDTNVGIKELTYTTNFQVLWNSNGTTTPVPFADSTEAWSKLLDLSGKTKASGNEGTVAAVLTTSNPVQ
jgi:hypothetical protein